MDLPLIDYNAICPFCSLRWRTPSNAVGKFVDITPCKKHEQSVPNGDLIGRAKKSTRLYSEARKNGQKTWYDQKKARTKASLQESKGQRERLQRDRHDRASGSEGRALLQPFGENVSLVSDQNTNPVLPGVSIAIREHLSPDVRL